MMPTTPSRVGARSEAAVASALVRSGYVVYVPVFATNGRVDLVYERLGVLVRVQCKTARLDRTALRFHTTSLTNNQPVTYQGQIDEFGVYAPTTNKVSLVPVSAAPSRLCTLRVDPARNGQAAGVRWAADYELGPP